MKEEINYIDSAADWIILGFSNGKISVFKNETSWKVEEFVIGADDKVLYSILQDGIYYCHTKQRVWKYNTFSNQLDVHIDQKLSSFHIDSDYEYLGSQYSNFLVSSRKIIKQEKIPLKSTFSHITSSQLYLFLVSSSGVSALVKNDWTLKTTLKSCNFKKESTNCKASFVFINKKKRCFTFCSNHHLNVYNAQTLEFEFLNICKDPQIQSHPYILKAAITKNTLIYQTYDNLYKVSFDSTIEQIKKT
ncbi:MAG: hypothetical protein JHC93_06535 [Parachlamydiales bacterium]|nr:hypothetical protein [Parachlamydiales bacterium]